MLIYVTGAAGFIGSHLVDRLLSLGHRVIGTDNLVRGTKANLELALQNKNFHFFELDITDRAAVEATLYPFFAAEERVDTVWHLAANSDIAAGVADPEIDLRDTFMTTFETVALARKFGMRQLAFASTSAVYGETSERLVETLGPLLPISAYGAMKLAGEAIISAAAESFLDRAWIFRFPNVVGSRGTHGVIRDLIDKLLVDRNELEVLGDGEQKKPYLHVADLVNAMIFIWQTAIERRALYNIGPEDDGAKVSFIASSIVEASKTNAQLRYTGGDRGWVGDVPRFSYSVEKLAKLGWRPSGGSEAAVRRAIDELIQERGLV
ncbi:SDR family NAD(P)-dependent oxidoreductase [Paraburkholderia fungorum]|uniref:SDR family NAD(P)-dependent oxidoreductase n=1 Tax=Paraburkholderia fungorum TaxID=134537 RepID=A0AAP5QJH3_9BURK|nr:SDR family NAD(P)-dependent oxidoreductase [Paraburkholderia fungorum]MDT8843422.1 SDR family NAD(P)-dependent oxidoreductase [Paraburkholderia fungorum]PRZ46259.1 UDP-glucose 4-epimerase [Paraburkholderia fungorum]